MKMQQTTRTSLPYQRRMWVGILALLLVLLLNVPTFLTPTKTYAAGNGFVTRSGSQLLLNGQPFRFSGGNIPWLGVVSDQYEAGGDDLYYPSQYMVDDAFQTINEMGGTVVRAHTLGASQGCALCIEPALGQFNETALRHVDYAIASAAAHHIHLIIPLVDNNWGWYYGGINTFTSWRGLSNPNDFYSNATVINDFKAYISMLLNRVNTYTGIAYKNDPTILAWETGNELGSSTTSWLSTIASYIKSIDPNHLVMDGDSGGYTSDSSRLSVAAVDMYTEHFYNVYGTAQPWPTVRDAQTVAAANKAYCVCEYGWDTTNQTQAQLQTNLATIASTAGVSGDLFWALEPHADLGGFSPVAQTNCHGYGPGAGRSWWGLYYTGVNTVCQTATDMAQRAQILRTHAYAMSGLSVPAHAIPPPPLILSASGGTVIWRGSAGASAYTIQRSSSPSGPWQTVCNACVSDTSGGWHDPSPSGSTAWYQVIPLNLDGVSGPASSPLSTAPDGTTAWVEDATPPGAILGADGGDTWNWITSNPTPYAGSAAHQSAIASGEHQHYFTGASTTITPGPNSLVYSWVYLDPNNPPTGIMLQWNDGQAGDPGWRHRAYWGTNCTNWGSEGTVSQFKEGALPPTGGWVRLAAPASDLGLVNVPISGMSFTTCNGRATFDHAGMVTNAAAWVEDATPAGATLGADGGDTWSWVTSNPTPYVGSTAHQSAIASGEHQHYFTGATDTITPTVGSVVYSWVYLDPNNPPTGIILQWNDGRPGDPGWQHRAYWGNNCTNWGTEGTASRFKVGDLPPTGTWVYLAVPASAVGLEKVPISGMAFVTCDGRATFDLAGTQ